MKESLICKWMRSARDLWMLQWMKSDMTTRLPLCSSLCLTLHSRSQSRIFLPDKDRRSAGHTETRHTCVVIHPRIKSFDAPTRRREQTDKMFYLYSLVCDKICIHLPASFAAVPCWMTWKKSHGNPLRKLKKKQRNPDLIQETVLLFICPTNKKDVRNIKKSLNTLIGKNHWA